MYEKKYLELAKTVTMRKGAFLVQGICQFSMLALLPHILPRSVYAPALLSETEILLLNFFFFLEIMCTCVSLILRFEMVELFGTINFDLQVTDEAHTHLYHPIFLVLKIQEGCQMR